jgi:hypothetical protein
VDSQNLKDPRPRILDYQREMIGVEFASTRSILWPCSMIKVAMPVRRKSRFNIFEETVLRLADKGKRGVSTLAALTCLEEDLIEFILSRLRQHKVLNEQNALTGIGREHLANEQNQHSPQEIGSVFIDLIGGELLPVIIGQKPRYSEVKNIGYKVLFSTEGKDNHADRLKYVDNTHQIKPTSIQVAQIAKKHAILRKKYVLLIKKSFDFPDFKGVSSAITISPGSDLAYLHVRLVMLKDQTYDYHVTDPFGYGFSRSLQNTFRNYLAKNDGERRQIEKLREEATAYVHPPAKVSGFQHFGSHWDMGQKLRDSEKKWQLFKALESKQKQEQVKERDTALRETAALLYAALEWALRQFVYDFSKSHWIDLFCSPNQTPESNGKLLSKLADKIGLKLTHKGERFLEVPPGKFRHAFDHEPEMQPLVGLAIAQACDDGIHPLNHFAKKNPDWLSMLVRMKAIRDGSYHGEEKERLVGYAKYLFRFRRQVHDLVSLLPGVKRIKSKQLSSNEEAFILDDLYNKKLIAHGALEKHFGYNEIHLMKDNLREELLKVEMKLTNWSNVENNEVTECSSIIYNLYSSLEIAVNHAFKAMPSGQSGNGGIEYIAEVTNRALKYGFKLEERQLPKALIHVNQSKIKKALKGYSQTLGANLIALFVVASEDWLSASADSMPELILITCEIITLRGHANEATRKPMQTILDLKQASYAVIEILLEA